jgi:LAS superfamily LD-carboxypeptidase LdcB
MRPDVARAFDRMAAAARRDGIYLIVVSGYRSDAEQARLFAAQAAPQLFRLLEAAALPRMESGTVRLARARRSIGLFLRRPARGSRE